jgi:STE24 endopeptidase
MTATFTAQGYNGAVRRTVGSPALLLLLIPLAWWLWQAQLPGHVPGLPARAAFTAAQIARARGYRDPTYPLAVLGLLLPPLVAVGLAWRGGDRLAVGRRPAPAAAGAAFAVAVLTSVVDAPLAYVAHVRAVNRGLDLQSDAAWAAHALLGVLAWGVVVAVGYSAARAVALRARPAWLGVGLAAWAVVAAFALLQPLAWDPLFMSTHRLAEPRARAVVSALERRTGVHPASVTVSDASSRTTTENAFVDGLGPTGRMVIDDTALRGAGRGELGALVAHELAHLKRRHVMKGVLWFGVLGLPGLWLLWRVLEPVARRRRGYARGLLDPRATALVLAGVLVLSTLALPIQNAISRRYEAEADWIALRTTGDGPGMVRLQRRLALSDLANPQPPGWAVALLFDHPPVMQRIAVARAYPSSEASGSLPDANSGRFLIPSRVRHLE